MFAVCAGEPVRAIVGDGVEFVEFVFAESFGAQSGDAESEAGQDEDGECDEDECAAVGEYTATGETLRS